MGFSYSKVETHHQCPYKFKLRYIDKLDVIPDESANNALYLGTACHEGIESRDVLKALESYKSHYNEILMENEIELIKLENILPKAIEKIPHGEYEKQLLYADGFIGYIDCLVPIEDGVYDLLDFKYSNNVGGYKRSAQVHVYKYYYEKLTGNKIRDMYYVFIPKSGVTLTEGMDLNSARNKIEKDLNDKDIIFEKIEYDPQQVNFFFARKVMMDKAVRDNSFEKRYSTKCKWCEFQKYCSSNGIDTSELVKKDGVIEEISLF